MNYLIAFVLLLIYFAVHSILASDAVKNWVNTHTGSQFRFYRLAYNVLAAALLLIILIWMAGWSDPFLFEKSHWTSGAAVLLITLGAGISIVAMKQYDMGEFMGFQQLHQQNTLSNHSNLNVSGLNAYVRHPLYSGTILLLLGVFLFYPKMSALLLLASVLIYLPFGIYFEEKKLRGQFGQAYEDYAKRVRCLIPFLA